MFKTDKKYGFVFDSINHLMQKTPTDCYRLGFKPELITIHWSSLFECTQSIIKKMDNYKNEQSQMICESFKKIEEKIF